MISWLAKRQPRGTAFTLPARYARHFGHVLFARALRPDPSRPDRLAFMIVNLAHHAFGPTTSTRPVFCFSPLQPLGQLGSISCIGRNSLSRIFLAKNGPISFTYMWPAQIAHVAGIAADRVTAIKIFLANGRVIPAALRDNAFIADVPQSVAAKIVSYDKSGRPISVAILNGPPMRYQTYPKAVVRAPSSIAPARPYERLDLGNATLNGQKIIGATEAQVVAALGSPDRILRNTVENGVRIPDYLYGGTSQLSATTQIQFGKKGSRIFAVTMMFRSPRLVETRLGHILAMQPGNVQRAIQKTYPTYKLTAGYGTLDAHGCQFTFTRGSNGGHAGIYLGLTPQRPSQLNLIVRNSY